MRFSVLLVALLATTVLADGASIIAAMTKISDATAKLNSTVASFAGGLIVLAETVPLLIKSTTLLTYINDGTNIASSSANLTLVETIAVAGATSNLAKGVQSSLQIIVDTKTKSKFDHLLVISPVILINLEKQKAATNKFSAAVVSKVPEPFQGVAQSLVARRVGQELFLAPVNTLEMHNVLDIGPRPCYWVEDFAVKHPHTAVTGIDLLPYEGMRPPNVKLRRDNVELPWPAQYKSLKPGG
ncbi:hypothetical protein V502_00231 [Pseudogymnoascus sp. VKM F-4520 (FW-2644)]|nr:hypothetical protein V502_00231 [Pseudogymnoascus sp. VKM F-4520 (FW-2644)]